MRATGIGLRSVIERAEFLRASAGERAERIELNVLALHTAFGSASSGRSAAVDLGSQLGVDPADVWDSPMVLFGDVGQIEEKLLSVRESTGISYYVIFHSDAETFAPVVDRLAGR